MRGQRRQRKRKAPRTRRQVLSQEQTNVIDEAKYIINRAQRHEARVVELGALVFFSTDTGDAWMLDPKDRVAICLARAGEEQPYRILETGSSFSVDWSLDKRYNQKLWMAV